MHPGLPHEYRGLSGVPQVQPGAQVTQEFETYPAQYHTPEITTQPLRTIQYQIPPRHAIQSEHLEVAKVIAFQKAWRKDRNYTGKAYDILYDKTRMFITTCKKLEIEESQYHAVFLDIL